MNFCTLGLCVAILAISSTNGNNQQAITKGMFGDIFSDAGSDLMIVNDKVDAILANLNQQTLDSNLDPKILKVQFFGFKFELHLITVSLQMMLHHGSLTGLSTIQRKDDCVVVTNGTTKTATMPLQFEHLAFEYQYVLQFMNIGPKGDVKGAIANSTFTVVVNLDTNTGLVELKEFKLVNSGDVSVKFGGTIGIMDALLTTMVEKTIAFLEPLFKTIVYDNLIIKAVNRLIAVHNNAINSNNHTVKLIMS